MKGLLILVGVVVGALARPDIGLKIRESYQYQPPATNYGIPTGSYLPGNQLNTLSQHHSAGHAGHGYSGQASFQGPSVTNYQQQSGGIGLNAGYTGQNGYSGADYSSSSSANSQYSGNNGNRNNYYQGGGGGGGGSYTGEAQVYKHVYFYESPEDLPAPQIRLVGNTGAPQKNYKIIFIKAPSYQAPQLPQIPAQQQNEEKTLVYVLVKKTDDVQDIVLPTLSTPKQTKPEVFFIKYKTQKDAEAQIQSIQQGQQAGDSAQSVVNDVAFVSNIKDTNVNNYAGSSLSSSTVSGGQVLGGGGGGSSGNTHYESSSSTHQVGGHSIPVLDHTGSPLGAGHDHHHYESSSASHQVSGGNTGFTSSQNFGPAGASGPY